MRVMHVLYSDKYSGAENVVFQIINCFSDDKRFEFYYCSRMGDIKTVLEEEHINNVLLKKWTIHELRKAIKKINPDIIHAHDMKATLYSSIACGRKPIIAHIHNNNFDSRHISIKTILFSISALKAKHIFWVSKSAFRGFYFNRLFNTKSSILYNILDKQKVLKKVDQDRKQYDYDIVFVGRLSYEKNPQRLVRVFASVLQKRPNTQMGIIGSGELEQEIRKKIEDAGLKEYIHMLGFQNNPYKIMQCAKILLMTSRWEGLPMCALEAMALGLPIVSTPTDGLKEIISDGINGFLCQDDETIAQKCCDVLTNDVLYRKLVSGVEMTSKHLFDIREYKRKISDVYIDIVGG